MTQGFSSVVYPTINVTGSLKRGEQLIWQRTEYVTPFNGGNTFGYEPQRYRTEGHQMYAEAKGRTLIKDKHSGDRFRIAGDAGSQSARTTMSTLALAYAFQALSQAVPSVIRHG